jgi:hypothetical protein
MGRLTRDRVLPDWSFEKTFPGVFGPTESYHYQAIAVFVPSWFSYLQISIDSNDTNLFASAYDTSYNPNPVASNLGLDVNYLGDAGESGNFLGTIPRFFQVFDETAANSASGGTLIVVLNETNANAGLNSPAGIVVEGFSDTGLNEVTPEPVSVTLLGAGLLVLAVRYRRASRIV